MKSASDYLMENEEEAIRLELKTSPNAVMEEAAWCGIKPGMRVLDAGCGPGLVTSLLHERIRPGFILGVDYSGKRIEYATQRYSRTGEVEFLIHDLRKPIGITEEFDLIWARFVLEYNKSDARNIVKNLSSCLKSGGLMCLLDLDYNCLTHYELPAHMEKILTELMVILEKKYDFDPYAGRKLYSHLYDLGYDAINVNMKAHHLFYGNIEPNDLFNWTKKVEVASQRTEKLFADYPQGSKGFFSDFRNFFLSPRRFTYTPMIMCKGIKK
jgi:SAM-dependent methyltransferase